MAAHVFGEFPERMTVGSPCCALDLLRVPVAVSVPQTGESVVDNHTGLFRVQARFTVEEAQGFTDPLAHSAAAWV